MPLYTEPKQITESDLIKEIENKLSLLNTFHERLKSVKSQLNLIKRDFKHCSRLLGKQRTVALREHDRNKAIYMIHVWQPFQQDVEIYMQKYQPSRYIEFFDRYVDVNGNLALSENIILDLHNFVQSDITRYQLAYEGMIKAIAPFVVCDEEYISLEPSYTQKPEINLLSCGKSFGHSFADSSKATKDREGSSVTSFMSTFAQSFSTFGISIVRNNNDDGSDDFDLPQRLSFASTR